MHLVKQMLQSGFEMKDMGELHYCLGIVVKQSKVDNSVQIQQKHYILSLLDKYGLKDGKTVSTPSDLNVKLKKDDKVSNTVDPMMYQSLIRSLLYAAIATRPDISQAVGVVSKFNSKPSEAHLTAVKRIFRYLKGTIDIALTYTKSDDKQLVGYSDADFAGDLDDRHSTTGNIFLLSNGAVSWLSKKQPIVTLSTAEAEYISLSTAV